MTDQPDTLASIAEEMARLMDEISNAKLGFTLSMNRISDLLARYRAISSQANLDNLAAELANHNERMVQIGQSIITQDNRITDQPMFIVQQKVRDPHIVDTEADGFVYWHIDDVVDLDDEDCELTEDDCEKRYYRERWEFVTACFTEQGCKDYLKINGHNLKETRIYADGSYRNNEFRDVRKYLIAIANESAASPEKIQLAHHNADELLAAMHVYEAIKPLGLTVEQVREACEIYIFGMRECKPQFDALKSVIALGELMDVHMSARQAAEGGEG